ncbi:MAG: tetratricopeptide repeat protein [Deltaproteobacteria bacterium]|nr:tetratricopeptide repeat protein [Deltaproteobacteria bacterium]
MANNPHALFGKAERKRQLSKFLEAIPLYLEAKRLAPLDKELRSACYFSLGDTYRMVGEFTKAGRCYIEAHGLVTRLGDEVKALDALVGLGLSQRATGNFKDALIIFDKALKGYRKLNDMGGEAFTLWARAGALRIKGDLKGALKGFKEAKAIFSRLRDKSGVGYCLTGLGGASRVFGKPLDSYRHYTEANKAFRGLRDTFGVAYSYCGIANSLRMQGDFKGSLSFFRKAKENYRKIGDKVSYAYTLWGEGSSFQMIGNDKTALEDFKEAQKLFRRTKDRRGLIYCLLSIGQLEFKATPKKGIKKLQLAFDRAKALGLGVETLYASALLRAAKKGPGSLPLNLA